jgi:hypothetical protein
MAQQSTVVTWWVAGLVTGGTVRVTGSVHEMLALQGGDGFPVVALRTGYAY